MEKLLVKLAPELDHRCLPDSCPNEHYSFTDQTCCATQLALRGNWTVIFWVKNLSASLDEVENEAKVIHHH